MRFSKSIIALAVVLFAAASAQSDSPDGNMTGLQRRWMEVTAYCPCKKCCGKNACGVTASGQSVEINHGHFVAAPPEIPFNSLVSIPGYSHQNFVPVLDRGGAIQGNHLDVFFPTHAQATAWGRKVLLVTIVVAPEEFEK